MLTCFFFFNHRMAKAEECLQSVSSATDATSIVSSAPDAVWEQEFITHLFIIPKASPQVNEDHREGEEARCESGWRMDCAL